jgi:hypothetical protein
VLLPFVPSRFIRAVPLRLNCGVLPLRNLQRRGLASKERKQHTTAKVAVLRGDAPARPSIGSVISDRVAGVAVFAELPLRSLYSIPPPYDLKTIVGVETTAGADPHPRITYDISQKLESGGCVAPQ